MLSAVLCQRSPTHAPQSSNPHLPSRSLRATFQASYHSILRGLRIRGDDPNAPPLIFGDVLEEGTYPLAKSLLIGDRLVSGTQQSARETPPPLPLTQLNNCCPSIPKRPLPDPIWILLKAPVLWPLHSLG